MANGTAVQPTGLLGTSPQNFQGLLADPIFNLGLGLLSAGLSQPRSFGQALAQGLQLGGSLQQQQAQNQLLRERMQAEARQARARQQIAETMQQGRPATPGMVGATPGTTRPAGLLDVPVQTLFEAFPEQVAQGLLGQFFPDQGVEPNVVRTLRAAGIDPQSPEGQELIRRSIGGDDVSSLMAQLQLMQTQLEIQRQQQQILDARREAAEAERQGRSQMGDLRREIFSQLQLGQEAAQLLEDLEGTFGQTGFGADFRGSLAGAAALAQDILGGDSSDARRIASQIERLNSIATRFGFENFKVFSGAISDREVQIALGKDLSVNKTPEANRQALADRLEIALNQADIHGFKVENRDRIENLIARLRGQEAPEEAGAGAQPTGRVIDFSDLPE